MKAILNVFLAFIAILIVSCGGKDKKHPAAPCDSLEAIYKLKTVTRLSDMKDADSVLFQGQNNKCYLVVSSKTELNSEQSEKLEGSSANCNPCDSDKFCGTDRNAAKNSVANAYTLIYKNLPAFIKSLPSDDEMGKTHFPEIRKDSGSKRVDEEKKNIHIKQSWIYAIAQQSDGDYRIIIGDSPDKSKAVFFNVAISALPEMKNSSYNRLHSARQEFKNFFGINNCCTIGKLFVFLTPVEIEFAGSLFFNKSGYDNKSEIGFKNLKPKTYWEIHPITKIKYL